MTPPEIADRLLAEPKSARRLLTATAGTPGVSEAFMAHVLRLYATDHAALVRLRPLARLVVRHGDDPALGHRSLAVVETVRGSWADSAQEFLSAGDAAKTERDQLAFKIGAIASLSRTQRIEEAIELGHSLMRGLESLGERGLAGRAALNLGFALMEQDRYAEAWEVLDGLPARLIEAGYPMEAASASLALSTSLLFGGSATRARTEAQEAIRLAAEHGAEALADTARGNAAYADLLQGEPDLAVEALLSLRRIHEERPLELARTLEYLGDAYTAMNLWTEAEDAYREALAMDGVAAPLARAHLRLGLGQVLLAAGRAQEAAAELAKASRRYRKLNNLAWAAAAETDRAVGERALGKAGLRRIQAAVELARQADSPFHLCRALLVASEIGGSEACLDEAGTLVERNHYSRLEWRVEAERARRAGPSTRLRHYRRMFKAILREQARTSSFAGRVGYLRDKALALQAYLDELLAKPTKRRVQEAVDVIARSRAVALLDELLRARSHDLPAGTWQRLEGLRASLNDGDTELPTQGSRRQGSRRHQSSQGGLARVQRQWLEETYALTRPTNGDEPGVAEGSTILLESPLALRALSDRVQTLSLSPRELDSRLRWLSYDLLAPMADRNAAVDGSLCELADLGEQLIRPLLRTSGTLGVCPDGVLWRLPWLACLDAMGSERDLEIRIHPGLSGREPDVRACPAMLWVADHPDLPWAVHEAEAFLRRFPDAQVCRSAAEVRACLANGRASVLHVVTHSSHRSGHPMFSSLDFTDGPVVAAEIARSGLRADLVTLSGCDTGRLSDVNRLEPDGLVRAFLACGAGYVVGSAWPLDDEAAVRLYEFFYSFIVDGANIHSSLRSARRAVRQWKAHPYFWASPVLYGGYRS